MSFKINHEFWPAAHSKLWLCTKFEIRTDVHFSSQGSNAKVIELTTYRDWKQGAFSEASKNWNWPLTAKPHYGLTDYTTSYNLHYSLLEEVMNWFCCSAVTAKHSKVVYTHPRTEKSPYVTVVHSSPPQTKGRRRYRKRNVSWEWISWELFKIRINYWKFVVRENYRN